MDKKRAYESRKTCPRNRGVVHSRALLSLQGNPGFDPWHKRRGEKQCRRGGKKRGRDEERVKGKGRGRKTRGGKEDGREGGRQKGRRKMDRAGKGESAIPTAEGEPQLSDQTRLCPLQLA